MNVLRVSDHALDVVASLSSRGQTDEVSLIRFNGEKYIYKKYSANTLSHLNIKQLEDHIRWRHSLDSETRGELDSFCGWPTHIVEQNGKPCGVLVNCAPIAFWIQNGSKSEPRSAGQIIEAEFQTIDMNARIRFLGKLMDRILWLHSRDLAVGDLYYANILFAEDGSPYLIDMDCSVLKGCCPFDIRFEPAWSKEPNSARVHSVASDWYKFGRLVVQIVSRTIGQRELIRGNHPFSPRDELLLHYFAGGRYDDPQGILSTVAFQWQHRGSADRSGAPEITRAPSTRSPAISTPAANGSSVVRHADPKQNVIVSNSNTRTGQIEKANASSTTSFASTVFHTVIAIAIFYFGMLALTALVAGLTALLCYLPGGVGEWFYKPANDAQASLTAVWQFPSTVWHFVTTLFSN
ncbi:hypothetical protein [Buchananella felis]|uniref:hypothetical protein n=1 Tax=Buchananella felis TaxID=3231492 RepID=UPI003526F895